VIVKVRLLAAAADAAGRSEVKVEAPEHTTLGELMEAVYSKAPGLAELAKRIPLIVLVNGVRRGPEYRVRPGDEVAVMPPAGGGA